MSKQSGSHSKDGSKSTGPLQLEHQIPRGTMTGIRTFIRAQGSPKKPSRVLRSTVDEEYEDAWPLHDVGANEEHMRAIKVQQDVTMSSDDMC